VLEEVSFEGGDPLLTFGGQAVIVKIAEAALTGEKAGARQALERFGDARVVILLETALKGAEYELLTSRMEKWRGGE